MLNPVKWILPSLLVVLFVVIVAYFSSVQNIGTNSTSEVKALEESINLGSLRSNMGDDGEIDGQFFDKEELIANLTSEIVKAQKNHGYDLKLDYVFFDKNKQVTNEDKAIRSVQFRVQFLGDNGEVKSTSEKHLAINQYDNG